MPVLFVFVIERLIFTVERVDLAVSKSDWNNDRRIVQYVANTTIRCFEDLARAVGRLKPPDLP